MRTYDHVIRIQVFFADCGSPATPIDGTVILAEAGKTTFGATATQSCNEGYDLAGESNIRCQANGTWSAQPVTCTIKGKYSV